MTDQPPPNAKRPLPIDLVDLAAVAGAGLIVYGVALMHRPSAFIAAGAFLLFGAWQLARKAAA